jgi:hypothetical protein
MAGRGEGVAAAGTTRVGRPGVAESGPGGSPLEPPCSAPRGRPAARTWRSNRRLPAASARRLCVLEGGLLLELLLGDELRSKPTGRGQGAQASGRAERVHRPGGGGSGSRQGRASGGTRGRCASEQGGCRHGRCMPSRCSERQGAGGTPTCIIAARPPPMDDERARPVAPPGAAAVCEGLLAACGWPAARPPPGLSDLRARTRGARGCGGKTARRAGCTGSNRCRSAAGGTAASGAHLAHLARAMSRRCAATAASASPAPSISHRYSAARRHSPASKPAAAASPCAAATRTPARKDCGMGWGGVAVGASTGGQRLLMAGASRRLRTSDLGF